MRQVVEALNFFERNDIPGAPVLDFEQAFRQPQVEHMRTIVERTHEGLGIDGGVQVREVRQAGIFSDTPVGTVIGLYFFSTYDVCCFVVSYDSTASVQH